MKYYHLAAAIFWTGMIIPTLLWWRESILLIALMSLYANIEASLSAYAAESERKGG